MTSSSTTCRIREGSCTIVLDTQYWPVIITTWFGEANEAAITRFFVENDARVFARAQRERTPVVLISDAAHAERPSAKVRKVLADKTSSQSKDVEDLTLGSIIVVENALIRGAVTAMSWILPRMKDMIVVGDIATAIDRALELLDDRRIVRPPMLSPARYRRPAA